LPLRPSLAKTDRAFHLLASESPDAFRLLIDLALPDLLPAGARVDKEDLDESRLDIPAAELCTLVAQSLAENRATRTQKYMAAVAAATQREVH
jgi:hypothetical protein